MIIITANYIDFHTSLPVTALVVKSFAHSLKQRSTTPVNKFMKSVTYMITKKVVSFHDSNHILILLVSVQP
jgi:hypothetical protein